MLRIRKRRERRYRPSAPLINMRVPRPRVEIDRGLAWFVIWTAARAERRVESALRDAGLATYAPVETIRAVKRGRVVEDERLAIGRYLFVGLHGAHPQWDAVHDALEGPFGWWGMPGLPALGRVLKSRDGTALRVPAGALQGLCDGLSLFGLEDTSQARLPVGGAVIARKGILAGFRGIVESSDDYRVRALLDVFGRKTRVEFSHDQLEAA